jgi:glycine cleavage system transcriptional repressor
MIKHAVLTAIGADRPGLVEEVSHFIFEAGGNIEDSRMVNLRGQFAIMLLVGADEPALKALHAGMPHLLQHTGLHVELRSVEAVPSAASAANAPAGPALPYALRATAMDQAGLVHRIARFLKEQGINIEELETTLTSAPITGAPLFEMQMKLSVPAGVAIARLRQGLGALCDSLNVDWQLTAVQG